MQGFPGFFLPHATALAIITSPVLTKAIWETGYGLFWKTVRGSRKIQGPCNPYPIWGISRAFTSTVSEMQRKPHLEGKKFRVNSPALLTSSAIQQFFYQLELSQDFFRTTEVKVTYLFPSFLLFLVVSWEIE